MNLYLKTAKSTIIICCLFILQTTAFAQSNIRITIKNAEITLQKALSEVERQSLTVGLLYSKIIVVYLKVVIDCKQRII